MVHDADEAVAFRSRLALLKREQQLARDMAKLYQHSEASIKARIVKLMQQLETAQLPETREGKQWALKRLNMLLSQMQAELKRLAPRAAQLTLDFKMDNVLAASVDGAAMAGAMALGGSWSVLAKPALKELARRSMGETPLGELFAAIGPNASDALRGILFDGMAQGQHPHIMAKAMDKAVEDLTRTRAILIARTESMRAYRESSIKGFAENKDILRGWRWTAARSERTCVVCLALDGKIFDHGEQFGSHPACRCVPSPVSLVDLGKKRQSGAEWFATQDEAHQLKVLGPAKLKLYQAGHITLPDLVDRHETVWGPTASCKSVKQLVSDGVITHEQAMTALTRKVTVTPPPVAPQLTPIEVLNAKDLEIRNLPHERGICVNPAGEVIIDKDGLVDRVSFTPAECARMRDCDFTHNHPTSGGSFSREDVAFGTTHNLHSIRAVGSVYKHTVTRPDNGIWPDYRTVIDPVFRRFYAEVRQEFTAKIDSGLMTIDEADKQHYHQVWSRVFSELQIPYKRETF